jgi:probable F420-dependent oxidoreductase
MPRIALGPVGAVVNPGPGLAETAAGVDALGYSTVWVTGGPMERLGQLAEAFRATTSARVASGIIPVVRFPSDDVIALYRELEAEAPGRLVVGLGGAHGPQPLATLNAYLDRLDAAGVPASARVLAALGPKMLDLARERSSGAFPVLVTPEAVAGARARLGDDSTLAVEQIAVVEADPGVARELARGPLGMLSQLPAYRAHFRRQGFAEDDVATLSDRFVDAVVCWGDAGAVAARARELVDAGADHVALSLLARRPATEALAPWAEVAEQLVR